MGVEKQVIEEIENLIASDPEYWDFKENAHKNHIHKLIRYPATMVPLMQSKLIELFTERDSSIRLLLDPFMGSGTTLVEANTKGLDTIGIDINPFAYLITSVKLKRISLNLLREKSETLVARIENDISIEYNYWFVKIDKWFKPEVINELSIIKRNIEMEDDLDYRCVMWVAFAKTVQYSSNDRSSTFKLHIKSKEDIDSSRVDVKAYFKKTLQEMQQLYEEYYNGFFCEESVSKVYCGNSIDVLQQKIADNSIDIISTSPPYGDNATTVTYGQYSMLQLRWIPIQDLQIAIEDKLIENYSSIDRMSLGGTNYSKDKIDSSEILSRSKSLFELYKKLNESDEKKARKVVSFYIDYEEILKELFRVIKHGKYLVFTVGNRKVDNELVYLDKVTVELSEHLGGKKIYQFERNILNKRMPDKVSKLKNNKPVTSMKKETILIFVKS